MAAAFLAAALAAACDERSSLAPASSASPAAAPAAPAAQDTRPSVVFLGDSLTAGYGLEPEQAFPALLQARIDAEGLGYRVVNAGVSGDTSAGGRRRIDWLLRQPIAVLVIELGANDMLRGLDTGQLRDNLRAIVDAARAANPGLRVVIVGMRAAPNLGSRYGQEFAETFRAVARDTDSALVPFLLEGVAGDATLNQLDGMHPTADGQHVLADTVWQVLGPVLRAPTPAS